MDEKSIKNHILIVTGLSGAGKTRCVKILEDLNYFCVDNLPLALLPGFASLIKNTKGEVSKTAVVVDIREGEDFLTDLWKTLDKIEEDSISYSIIFLEASDEVLVRRFSETRRRHPLSTDGSILPAIVSEMNRLRPLRDKANYIVDTTNYSVKDLREKLMSITSLIGEKENDDRLTINVISFGYKGGVPIDADIVMDVRFLPNPFYEEALRDLNGLSKDVSMYVIDSLIGKEFIKKFTDLLFFVLPVYKKESKNQVALAFGCTGGKHRSVAIANIVGKMLSEKGYKVNLFNRDIYSDNNLEK